MSESSHVVRMIRNHIGEEHFVSKFILSVRNSHERLGQAMPNVETCFIPMLQSSRCISQAIFNHTQIDVHPVSRMVKPTDLPRVWEYITKFVAQESSKKWKYGPNQIGGFVKMRDPKDLRELSTIVAEGRVEILKQPPTTNAYFFVRKRG